MAFVKIPKYWLAKAPGGEVELERTKQRPNPGLLESSGKTEKTKAVEKEERDEEFEVDFMERVVG